MHKAQAGETQTEPVPTLFAPICLQCDHNSTFLSRYWHNPADVTTYHLQYMLRTDMFQLPHVQISRCRLRKRSAKESGHLVLDGIE